MGALDLSDGLRSDVLHSDAFRVGVAADAADVASFAYISLIVLALVVGVTLIAYSPWFCAL